MVASNSRFSYGDCFDLMNKAIADPKGIQIKFASREEALHFRMRIHKARNIDRTDNLETYPNSHAMHGRSAYDPLICRIKHAKDGGVWLRVEKVDAREFEVESLSVAIPEPELDFVQTPRPKILEVRPVKRRM